MTDHKAENDFNEADSRADAIAALALILIAVCAVLYFVSGG